MLSMLITVLIIRFTRKIGRGGNTLTRLYLKFAHLTGAFFAALEGHLILRYIYPNFYILVFFLQRHTGIDLSGALYD